MVDNLSAPENKINFNANESFEIDSNGNNYVLKISLNEKLIFLEIEEKNTFPKGEYNIYLNLEELGKINRYFLQFDSLKEVLESFKKLINKKNVSIVNETNKMKIKLINPANDKEIFINVPLKEKDLKSEMNSLVRYVATLNERIQILEKKLDEIYVFKNDLIEKKKEKEHKKELEKTFLISEILNKNEVEIVLNWLENKPKKINLLLNSRIDGDKTETFYNKCEGKYPTIVFVKTTKGHRFGGYSSISWKNLDGGIIKDEKSFIFSLDKQKKYDIKNADMAIQTSSNYFAFGRGTSDFYVENNCTSSTNNYSCSTGKYNTTEQYELNGGEKYYTVSSYEVYQVEY